MIRAILISAWAVAAAPGLHGTDSAAGQSAQVRVVRTLPIYAELVILAIHAYLGLHVIARGVIFVDLAFAQIAALGTTVGILLGVGHGPGELLFALGFTLLGALIFSFTRIGIGASFYWDLTTGPLLVCAFGLLVVVAAVLRSVLGIRPDPKIVVRGVTD